MRKTHSIRFQVDWCVGVTLLVAGLSGCGRDLPERPNVLLIMTDDQGYGDYGFAGNPWLETPALDQLADESVRFTRFYVAPVCAPTRAGLLTGRHYQRTGIRSVTNGFEMMDPDEVTLAEILAAEGYRTGLFGKWHLGEYYPSVPHAQGFDTYVGFRTGHFDDYYDPILENNGREKQTTGYITDVLTDEAIRFISDADGAPFFCYLPYNAPHTPLFVEEQWIEPYRELGLPDRTALVYGMISSIDANIGRLMSFLTDEGLADNTIVIFLSDNGPINGWSPQEWRYNADLRDQKFKVYEGGVRTQALIRYPARNVGTSTIFQPAAAIDLLPTVLDLLDIEAPDSLTIDGSSLRPLLEDPQATWSRYLLPFQYRIPDHAPLQDPHPGSALIRDRYKMVHGTELYDLISDGGERIDLATVLPDTLAALRRQYEEWWEEVNQARGYSRLPIPVGYQEEPTVSIAPHHGEAWGDLRFMGYRGLVGERIAPHPNGVDGDWIANWVSTKDRITWRLNVVHEGSYYIGIQTRVSMADAGARIVVTVNDETIYTVLPALPGEIGEWHEHDVGRVNLNKGPAELFIEAPVIPGETAMELGRVLITRAD